MELKVSKEYEDFLDEFKYKKFSVYEKACSISEKIFPIPISAHSEKKLQEAIDFCHLNISPRGAVGLTLLSAILFPLSLFTLGFFLGILTAPYIVLAVVFTISIFYFLYTLPYSIATSFRIKASEEMVLAVIYMSIAMKVIPNLEYAVKFAARNLTGPLAKDLRKMIWDLYIGKFVSVNDAVDDFISKWKRESEEFTEAVYLLKNSFFESSQQREKVLNEAVAVVLTGTKERMEHYAQELKTPVTVLNALGILLPIIGLVFFPLISIFLPTAIKPVFLIIGYNIILPLVVYWLMRSSLQKRPATFHQPDLSKDPRFANEKVLPLILFLSLAIPVATIGFSYIQLSSFTSLFSFEQLMYSIFMTWSIAFGIIFFSIFSTINKLKVRDEVASIESELGEVMFQIGSQLTRGMPIEAALKNSLPRIRELKMSKMVEKILYNMENLGMTFGSAVFDPEAGAIRHFSSKLIAAVMNAISEVSRQGMSVLSDAMLSISTFLKNMHAVEEDLEEKLGDITSTMEIQATLLAPLSAGIVVAISAMVLQIVISLTGAIESIQSRFDTLGAAGFAGNSFLNSIIKVNEILSIHNFQLIVGIYMIEVVAMIAVFLSIIKYGDESLMRRFTLGKTLLLATAIYSAVLIFTYTGFSSLVPSLGFLT